tara:strand:- start:22 stop:381 length:360 start_codon:yes stop_codon:yes gene_type:complete
MPVSLWSNQGKTGQYRDETFYESDNIMVVKYFGQKKGGRDHLIAAGNYFFIKDEKLEESKRYTYKGRVSLVSELPKEEGINVYELVIRKEEPVQFRIKKDAYSHFKWDTDDVMSGIIKH